MKRCELISEPEPPAPVERPDKSAPKLVELQQGRCPMCGAWLYLTAGEHGAGGLECGCKKS